MRWKRCGLARKSPEEIIPKWARTRIIAISEMALTGEAMTDRILFLEDFSDKVGAIFAVSDPKVPAIPLTLVEATPMRAYSLPPNGRPPFSLIFRARDERILPQSIYRIEQEGLGAVELFLVPVGKNAEGIEYQAIFN